MQPRRAGRPCLHGQRIIEGPATLQLGFHASRVGLPGCPCWGLAPMVGRGRSWNRPRPIPLRYLIVDDNTSFREEMRGLLVEQGLDVVGGAGSAAEAVRQIAELRPDAALIDIDL